MSTLPTRYLFPFIKNDLKDKMVFLGGPRQVGKTTLAQSLIKNYKNEHPAYYNWDLDEHRKSIKDRAWPHDEKLVVFDEIHKYSKWRNLIKGYYDTLKGRHSFLVTGSARLDLYRKGGDSLLGRYYYYHLHPYSLPELGISNANLELLLKFGGFPEMLNKKNERTLRRWHISRLSKLIYDDIRSIENVKALDQIEVLAEELQRRACSILSYKSLAEDLLVDFKTIKHWIQILDSVYYSFRILPYGSPNIRAVKKEQKLYLWDWSQLEDRGKRFENLVASQLLKYCHFIQDTEGHKMELKFIRDTDKREIDFVVIKDSKPIFAVESKLSVNSLSPHIKYFKERMNIPKFYQVHLEHLEKNVDDRVVILPFSRFCQLEKMI